MKQLALILLIASFALAFSILRGGTTIIPGIDTYKAKKIGIYALYTTTTTVLYTIITIYMYTALYGRAGP
jgi:hypothetical protein